jgi:hypothetical protein
MAAIGITGMGLTGVIRMNWVHDDLTHVLEHAHTDETSGTWTGRACPGHGPVPGGDVDDATLRRLAGQGAIADLTWEAPDDIAAGHAHVFQGAIAAYQAAELERAEELWEKVRAIWSRAWSARTALARPRRHRAGRCPCPSKDAASGAAGAGQPARAPLMMALTAKAKRWASSPRVRVAAMLVMAG